LDIAAAGLNANLMSVDFSTDCRRKAQRSIGSAGVLKN
jgi:hypothetical protein